MQNKKIPGKKMFTVKKVKSVLHEWHTNGGAETSQQQKLATENKLIF